MTTHYVTFYGYYADINSIPDSYGVYIAYTFNRCTKYLTRLVYIGKAKDQTLQERISQHIQTGDLDYLAKDGEGFCFAYAALNK